MVQPPPSISHRNPCLYLHTTLPWESAKWSKCVFEFTNLMELFEVWNPTNLITHRTWEWFHGSWIPSKIMKRMKSLFLQFSSKHATTNHGSNSGAYSTQGSLYFSGVLGWVAIMNAKILPFWTKDGGVPPRQVWAHLLGGSTITWAGARGVSTLFNDVSWHINVFISWKKTNKTTTI